MSVLKNDWFLSCTSKKTFTQKFKRYYSDDDIKINNLHFDILKQLNEKIIEGDLCGFKMFIDFICIIRSGNEVEKIYFPDNPFNCTNIVIVVCLNNNVSFLKYVLENLDVLSKCIGANIPKPEDKDETCHNAFYYAIRSNNTKLLETLIKNWPNNYFDHHEDILEEIISTAYNDLLLTNVYLSYETKLFVEGKLLDMRFCSVETSCKQNYSYFEDINDRINLVIDNVNVLVDMKSNVDEKFIKVAKFVAKNIFTLKSMLKSTYDKIPWEEIEFCLVCFIISKTKCNKLNIYYCEALPIDRMIGHLKTFSNKLGEIKNTIIKSNIAKFQKLPPTPRNKIISKIIKRNPQFVNLYNDYRSIRDVTSLEVITSYASFATKADPNSTDGQLLIIRALIIVGEHLKNTLESPKLSKTTSDLVLVSLPKPTANILMRLRNSLAHGHTMAIRKLMEEFSSDFFSNIKNDFNRVCVAVSDIATTLEDQWIRKLLEKIISLKNVEELKDVLQLFRNFNISEESFVNADTLDCEKKFEDIFDKLFGFIKQQSFHQKFNETRSSFKIDQAIDKIVIRDYLLSLKYMSIDSNYIKLDSNILRGYQFRAKHLLRDKKLDHDFLRDKKYITSLTRLIHNIKCDTDLEKRSELKGLCMHLFNMIELNQQDVNFLTEFNDMLMNYQLFLDEYECEEKEIVDFDKDSLIRKKCAQIQNLLIENGLTNISNDKFLSYKGNQRLQILLEMLLLDCLSLLETTSISLSKNICLFDQKVPSLFGRHLRNHLAHINLIVDILCDDFQITLLLNCQKLIDQELLCDKIPIVKTVEYKSAEYLKCDLELIDLQQKMFRTNKEGDLLGLEETIKLGADINGRDMNLRTIVHYATQYFNRKGLEFVGGQNVNVNVTDIYGQTPLHIAASLGWTSVLADFIREHHIHIDSRDNLGRTPLHIASQGGHKDVVLFLLEEGANHSLKDFQQKSPLHKAIEFDHVQVTKILLEKDILSEGNLPGGFMLLHMAAENGSYETTKLLLLQKCNVNAKTDRNTSALHLASLNGHINVVEALIKQGADVNARSMNGGSPLHNAVETGCQQIVEILLKNGADVNITYCGSKITPLHLASGDGRENILKILLKNGANVNNTTEALRTPLHWAAENGNINILLDLLRSGANINAKDISGFSALHIAIDKNHDNFVEILVMKGANVNSKHVDGCTPLHLSAKNGNAKISKLLLQNGASVEMRDKDGRCPLHLAALSGNVGVIDLLVQYGSYVNIRDCEGSTPILFGISLGHLEATKYFINNGAELSCCNNKQMTPLLYAIHESQLDIVEILLEHKRDLIHESCSNITCLQAAVQQSNTYIISILLKHGADVNKPVQGDTTPLDIAATKNDKFLMEFLIKNGANIHPHSRHLFLAVYSGFKDIVEILLKHGVNPNVSSDNTTPLHVAVTKGHQHIVQILLHYGANINVCNDFTLTPLLLAASAGHKEIVKILLKKGAKPNATDSTGSTPLHYAVIKSDNVDLVELLLKQGSNVRVKDHKNRFPIDLAVAHNCIEIVKILLLHHKKSDIHVKCNDDYTLLHIAAENGCTEIVQLLIDKGADVHSRTIKGAKPIHLATREGFKDTVELLLKHGCHINEAGAWDQTLLHYAAMYGKLVEFVLSRGADVNVMDSQGKTPLHIAASCCETKETVEILLANGAVYNAVDSFQRTPLMLSTSLEIINLFLATDQLFQSVKYNKCHEIENHLKLGAFINSRNSTGNTPLHFAAWKNFKDVVKILLQNKAHSSIANNTGFTPLHYATKFSHLEVTKTLLLNGAMFDAKSVNSKTPLQMATDNDIIGILKLIKRMFHLIKNNNVQVVHELGAIKDMTLVKIIMNAQNSKNESLITCATRRGFPFVEYLKNILQGDNFLKIIEARELISDDQSQKALHILQPIFEQRQKLLGTDNPGTLDIQELIANALYQLGSYEKALEMFNDLLIKQEKNFGKLDKTVLRTQDRIALSLHRQGKDDEAYKIYQNICPKLQNLVGPEDENTLNAKFHMALVLHKLGKWDEALSLNREVLAKMSKVYGENHGLIVSAQNNIAMVLAAQQNYEEAIKIYEQVYEKKKKTFGVNNQSTLNTKHSIAAVYKSLGNYPKAIAIWKELLVIQKQILEPDHDLNLRVQYSIAELYLEQNKLISAYEIYRDIVALGVCTPFGINASSRINSIKKMLESDVGMFEIIENHQNRLIRACSLGDLHTVIELLKYGGNINGQDASGHTPLHHATSNGQEEVVATLLKNGANPSFITNKANTSLHLAVSRGFNNIVNELLKHIKDDELRDFVNARTSVTGTTALHVAAKNGFFDIIVSLLSHNAIYNIRNYQNETPLSLSKEINIQILLKNIDKYFEATNSEHMNILEEIRSHNKNEIRAILGALNANKLSLLQVAMQHKRKQFANALKTLEKTL